ncbi:hypothetical protein AB0N89_33880 [Amycolatopsis sp. NPDC089917]|uniref:hypothetical protein n=1 Tax=Amycolatopsis sp. NPDC089917 TaxID=3155187 RepID=UPI0034126B01
MFRKTVATILDEADLPTTQIAGQLDNTVVVVEKHYRKKRVANAQTAEAMEGLDWLSRRRESGRFVDTSVREPGKSKSPGRVAWA